MMKSKSILIFLILILNYFKSNCLDLNCRCKLGIDKKIVGGGFTPQNYVPWFSALLENGKFVCGAFILNEYHIVTASHCTTRNARSYQVAVGINSLKNINSKYIYNAEKLFNHPQFNENRLGRGHDISILKLKKPINFELGKIEPGCITFKTTKFDSITVAGFGSVTKIMIKNGREQKGTYQDYLKYALFYEVGGRNANKFVYVKAKKSGEDTCNGDSGSPGNAQLSGRTAVIGVVSWGTTKRISSRLEESCNGITAFCRLTYEKNFIERYVNKSYCSI